MSTTGTTTVDDLKSLYGEYESALNSQYAKASSELKRQYNQSLGVVDQSRKGSRQAASISLDKLKKYLPEQLAAEGLGNLGMSQTAYVRAQNNYQNQLAGIESDANAKRADLYNSYANNRSALERQKTRDLLDLYSKRDAAIYQAERDAVGDARYEDEQTKADQLAFYNNLAAMIDNGTFDSTEALKAYLNADTNGDGIADVYGNLGDNYKSLIDGKVAGYQYLLDEKQKKENEPSRQDAYIVAQAAIENLIAGESYDDALAYLEANKETFGEGVYNAYVTDINQKQKAKAEKEKEKEEKILAGNEAFEYQGEQFRIKSKLRDDANEITHNNSFTKQLEAAGYSDPKDPKIPNGTTFKIKCDNDGKNQFDYFGDIAMDPAEWETYVPGLNFYNYLDSVFDWNTRYVTYYNGNWYLSEDQKQ